MTEATMRTTGDNSPQGKILIQLERLKTLAEREQTLEIATEGQLIADVIGEAFEEIANSKTENLTEHELWQKFISSKVQLATSNGPTVAKANPRDFLDTCSYLQDDMVEISESLFRENGALLIDAYIDELSIYVDHLKTISRTFEVAKEAYLVLDKDGDVPDGLHRYRAPDWEQA